VSTDEAGAERFRGRPWKPTLVWDLLWKVRWKERTPRPVEGRIPSSSWAPADGVVEIRVARLKSPHKLLARILDVRTDRGPGPFGHVPSGRIKLQGPVLRFSTAYLATSQTIELSEVWWNHGLSKSAAKEGNTTTLTFWQTVQ